LAKKQFKAETRRLMDLMINSIYTHKEIFLREIISNASDAIDKLCYLSLTDQNVGMNREDYEIRITLNKDERTLVISDNGIGMDEEDLEKNLGIIANSGSLKFREEHKEEENAADDLIGQFGVGFYSAFMVADKITVLTRKYGSDQGYKWVSDGVDGYTITPVEKKNVGTSVAMHLREDPEEDKDEFSKYIREYTIYKLVKKYSDYIRWPIRMLMPNPVMKEGCDPKNPEFEEKFEYETLNSMKPLWQRKKGEVTQEEYDEFFKEHFLSQDAPQRTIPVSVEGNIDYTALLFIPAKASVKYDTDEYESGLELYSQGVKIMDKCSDLMPEYFNFVRGVVDSPDISLNISREMLQHDRQLKLIRTNLEKKVKAELEKMLKNERDDYETFYRNFGRQLKICAIDDFGKNKEQLQDLMLFWSSKTRKLITLAEYVEGMKEEQKYIYFASGDSLDSIDHLPQMELLKEHDMEVLYFTDKVDELVAEMMVSYKEKSFRNAVDGDLELAESEEKPEATESQKEALEYIKTVLGEKVDEVKASTKLKSHPVILSSGEGVSFDMERYFRAMNPEMNVKAKKILELNTEHEAFRTIDVLRTTNPERAAKYVEILYQQGRLIAGIGVEDPTAYTDLLCGLWN